MWRRGMRTKFGAGERVKPSQRRLERLMAENTNTDVKKLFRKGGALSSMEPLRRSRARTRLERGDVPLRGVGRGSTSAARRSSAPVRRASRAAEARVEKITPDAGKPTGTEPLDVS